mmetsp:Transcript_35409/g.110718  ORF Transcript_35409/g.110718 Transcript_35409/m.110718 type:complete len:88 (+) Transcript_35409:1256-1519(+)
MAGSSLFLSLTGVACMLSSSSSMATEAAGALIRLKFVSPPLRSIVLMRGIKVSDPMTPKLAQHTLRSEDKREIQDVRLACSKMQETA